MMLEVVVAMLVVLGYWLGSYADERRSRRQYATHRRLRPLREASTERPRMPLPSSP